MGSSFSPPVRGAGDYSTPINYGSGPAGPLYVGNGGYATIQAAVNAAQPGDTVFIQPGTYDENVTVTTDYITLQGAQVSGYGRPDLVATTGAALTVTAQGFVARRIRFSSGDEDCVVQRGNGFKYIECVFDGDTQAADECLLRLLPSDTDDSFTASEGLVQDCLFRGCPGVGVIFDTGAAPAVGVGSTDNVFVGCLFRANTGADMATADTGGGVYSVQGLTVKDCSFEDKNKATYLDFTTTNGGAAGDQSGTVEGNYFASDTMTTTKIKAVGTAFTFVGNYDTVGIFDGSGLD